MPNADTAATRPALVAAVAVLAATIPHAFLDHPLAMVGQSEPQVWIGMAIWAPALLAAAAIFFGGELNHRAARPWIESADWRAAVAIALPVAVFVVLSALRADEVRIWGWDTELALALAVFMAAYALSALFWQGLVQPEALAGWPSAIRPVVVTAASLLIWAPFYLQDFSDRLGDALIAHGTIGLALAVAFECGISTIGCVLLALFCGGALVWTNQLIW